MKDKKKLLEVVGSSYLVGRFIPWDSTVTFLPNTLEGKRAAKIANRIIFQLVKHNQWRSFGEK